MKYGNLVLPELPATDWAYLAGLIDGEGTVNIDAVFKGENQKYLTFRPALVLVSTTPEILDWVWERLPYGSKCTNRQIKAKWKAQHRILWVYRPATLILEKILPYLTLKKPQAEIVLAMPLAKNKRWDYTEEIREAQKKAWFDLRKVRGSTSGRAAPAWHKIVMFDQPTLFDKLEEEKDAE